MTARIVVDALQVPAELTGVGRQAQAVGASLADAPTEVAIELRCTREARPMLAPSFPERTVVRTPLRRSRPRLVRIAYQQVIAPLRERPDTLLVSLGDQGPLFGRSRRLLVINDVRRLGDGEGGAERHWYRFVVPRAARRADRVATISDFSARELARLVGVDAVVIAHHPPPVVDDPPPSAPEGPVLVIGALRSYKGIDTVVTAIERLPGVRLVLAGPPGDAAVEPTPSVEVRGWVSEDELELLYRSSAVVVAPSRYEGYGLPVAESLARGRPTVASDIPPHREIGGDAVLYFPPGDAEALAAQIAQAIAAQDTLARAALERSRALAAERPTWCDVILGSA